MKEEDVLDLIEACGKAFGFALACALVEPAPLDKPRLRAFADSLGDLIETECFSPHVGIVMSHVVQGMQAQMRGNLGPSGEFV